jgi:hypothetical protein
VYLLLFVTLLERINSKFNVKTVSYEKHAKQKLIHLFIGNLYIFPLISSSDIVSINLMTLILENIISFSVMSHYSKAGKPDLFELPPLPEEFKR